MERIVGKLTQSYLKKLPAKQQYYTEQEFREAGFPDVLLTQTNIEIDRRLKETLQKPETDWADTETEEVVRTWQMFYELLQKNRRIPETFLSGVIENAIEQCLELAVKPREAVPRLLFGNSDRLDLDALKEQSKAISVNRHLVQALLRYMDKKEKSILSFEDSKRIIRTIDQKLVANYTPLKWFDLLQPLFSVAGPAVDPELLRIFFEEKGKTGIAEKFGEKEEPVTDRTFIEILSTAELFDTAEQKQQEAAGEQRRPDLFGAPHEAGRTEEGTEEAPADENTEDAGEDEEVTAMEEGKKRPDQQQEDPEEEPSLNDLFGNEGVEVREEESYQPEKAPHATGTKKVEQEGEDLQSGIVREEKSEPEPEKYPPLAGDVEDHLDSETSPDAAGKEKDVPDEEEMPLLNRFMFDETFSESRDEDQKKHPGTIYEELSLVREEPEEEEKTMSLFDNFTEPAGGEKEKTEPGEATGRQGKSLQQQQEVQEARRGEEEQFRSIEEEERAGTNENAGSPLFTEEEEHPEDEDGQEEDVPMWKSFLERNDLDDEPTFQFDEEYEESGTESSHRDEDGFTNDPVMERSDEEPDPQEILRILSGWMGEEEEKFIEELFGNSAAAYEEALVNIMKYESWKRASKYIEREVFTRNHVDVYSEIAVDFTDRLHSYFLQYKS